MLSSILILSISILILGHQFFKIANILQWMKVIYCFESAPLRKALPKLLLLSFGKELITFWVPAARLRVEREYR